ncbi:MAG: Fur family transcriptional regulator [Prolixibacteraceae bacterium]|nr:MAG: Fur family transcriptional regulator [Prolixibacteraceae bacterium]
MKAKEILHQHNLVRTSCRQSIIDTIANLGFAVSEDEIKQKVEGNYDRTTFYRSFKTLIEKNIIHKIVVDNQLVKYAITESGRVSQNHVHFYCNLCEVVECMPDAQINIPPLPNGYRHVETELIIKGFCHKCNL